MTRILHLSDTHMTASGTDMDGVDAIAALEGLLHDARHVPDLDLVVVSGDLADDGSVEGCEAVRQRVGAFAAARGAAHVYSTGNHDDRVSFRQTFGSGHLNPDGTDRGELFAQGEDLCAAVSDVDGLRIVTLDSLVPGKTHGLIGASQLAALSRLLASPAPHGSVLVFHHPPLRLASLPYVARVVLQDIGELAEVVRGTDVRAILTGHLHFQLHGYLAGVPTWVTPGVVTRIDTSARPHIVRGVLGASATIVDLGDPATFHLLLARDPKAGEEVYVYDVDTGEDVSEPT